MIRPQLFRLDLVPDGPVVATAVRAFALDEIVAPVFVIQDLTAGPFLAGVTPASGTINVGISTSLPSSFALILNDKAGSVTDVLGDQFDGRSFTVTNVEIQNKNILLTEALEDLQLSVASRANVFAGTPTLSNFMPAIQFNPGTKNVPVEMYSFDAGLTGGLMIWRGILGDNTNTLGTRRTLEPEPGVTIGPDDAIILRNNVSPSSPQNLQVTIRGIYQEQPA